jgi:diaminopimelate dehydrogenase
MPQEKMKVAIVGYGNVGRGVRLAIERNPDMGLVGIVSRRPGRVIEEVPDVEVFSHDYLLGLKADVAILCGGSAKDLPEQGPFFARYFNTVDSFDTHADIPGYFGRMNEIAKGNNNVAIISAGWDPGTFSLERVLGDAFIPGSRRDTFWGPGVSQGHSDAIRRLEGVVDAIQYTIPVDKALKSVRAGENPELTTSVLLLLNQEQILKE